MSTSFQSNVYQGSNKLGFSIITVVLIITIISIALLSFSFIPFIISSLILVHSIFHVLIKNLMTFKATEDTVLIINDDVIEFKSGDQLHWSILKTNVDSIDIDQKKYSILIKTKDNDSYSIDAYCFDNKTALEIQSLTFNP
ncbi:MAG: hypothetical protein HRU38_07820 [Saccharospirillaceae bacterium]|nr:hypothetical protein [Pseudomonadales bacterium]NRB78561.1 hypothetical protein [Saccharospirillaceae bacterium]